MKSLRVLEGSLLYLVIGVLFLTSSLALSYINAAIEIQLVVTQYFIIGFPPVLYLWIKKKPILRLLRIQRLSIKTALLVILLTLLFYPIAVLLNTIIMLLLSLLGPIDVPQVPTATTSQQYFLYLIIIAFSAGICEEIMFRGFIMRSYEKVGYKFAIIFSALLFGVFHFNIYNLGATIFFGVFFGYLVLLTNSLWAGIIGHIANNAFAVTLGFFANRMQEYTQDILPETGSEVTTEMISSGEILMAIGFFGFIALGTGFAAILIIKYLRRIYHHQDPLVAGDNTLDSNSEREKSKGNEQDEKNYHLKEFFPIIPIFIMFFILVGFQLYQVVAEAGII